MGRDSGEQDAVGVTTLGVVIGVVTVTLMGTAINGLNRALRDSISAWGPTCFTRCGSTGSSRAMRKPG
jgi:ABC-type lipoprotein release transport system permease subunit